MTNGMQKYLMIAFGAVFLWGFSDPLQAQELERTVLPMEDVFLTYKEPTYVLLTKTHAEQLDKVINHMRNKPVTRYELATTYYEYNEVVKTRFSYIISYIKDQGIDTKRFDIPTQKQIGSFEGKGAGSVRISELSK